MTKKDLKMELFRARKIIEGSNLIDIYEEYNKKERDIIDFLDSKIYKINTLEKVKNQYMDSNEEIAEKYCLFGLIFGLIDGTINSKLESNENVGLSDLNLELDMRNIVVNGYNKVRPLYNDREYLIDYMICNYPSYKNFDNFSSLPKECLNFIKMYVEGYQISDKIDFNKISRSLKMTMNILVARDSSTKKYIKSINNDTGK